MMKRRWMTFLLSLVLCLSATVMPTFAEASVSLLAECQVPTDRDPQLGDLLTYSVTVTANADGFDAGTVYFLPSDNLTYVSATRRGATWEAMLAVSGEYEGAYGIAWIDEELYAESGEVYCTMTFRVTDLGQASVKVDVHQLVNGEGTVTVSLLPEGGVIEHTVAEPAKPIVTTEVLPKAILEQEMNVTLTADRDTYLVWRLVEGTLPTGVTLSEDGLLAGTPTEEGTFTFHVVASVLGKIDSDPKELTLTVSNRPQKLVLKTDSTYRIGEEGFLTGVVERTSRETLLSQFENVEWITVYDPNGNLVTSASVNIGTGYRVCLMDDGKVIDTVTVVVLGDLNGNGQVDPLDYQRVRRYLFGNYDLSGAALRAACVSGRSDVTPIDYQRIRRHIFGNFDIYA